jgi:hypothetical protein
MRKKITKNKLKKNTPIIDIERDLFLVGSDDSNWQRLESPDIIDLQNAAMKGNESKIYFSGRTSGSAWDI